MDQEFWLTLRPFYSEIHLLIWVLLVDILVRFAVLQLFQSIGQLDSDYADLWDSISALPVIQIVFCFLPLNGGLIEKLRVKHAWLIVALRQVSIFVPFQSKKG